MSFSSDQIDDDTFIQFMSELHKHTGYDFSSYSKSSMKRRISRILYTQKLDSIEQLKEWVFSDPIAQHRFVETLSVPTTSMFRDPLAFKVIRTNVLPILKDLQVLRVWSVGCSTGEEAYSLAIMLDEEGLYDRSRIYATDINEQFIRKAQSGVFPLRRMQEYTTNYLASGGCLDFSSYFATGYDRVAFNESLKRNIVFAQHNLVSDRSFNEFSLILCRNVMIYFNEHLQKQVLELLDESLSPGGFIALGEKESLRSSTIIDDYEQLYRPQKIYRKLSSR